MDFTSWQTCRTSHPRPGSRLSAPSYPFGRTLLPSLQHKFCFWNPHLPPALFRIRAEFPCPQLWIVEQVASSGQLSTSLLFGISLKSWARAISNCKADFLGSIKFHVPSSKLEADSKIQVQSKFRVWGSLQVSSYPN